MLAQVLFRFDGSSQWVFTFVETVSETRRRKAEHVISYSELYLPNFAGLNPIRSVETSEFINDFRHLCEYFEHHIAVLQGKAVENDEEFVTFGLQFRLHAQQGEVIADMEGSFGVRVMLNTGHDADTGKRIFVGVQTTVQVNDVREFILTLRAVLREIERSASS